MKCTIFIAFLHIWLHADTSYFDKILIFFCRHNRFVNKNCKNPIKFMLGQEFAHILFSVFVVLWKLSLKKIKLNKLWSSPSHQISVHLTRILSSKTKFLAFHDDERYQKDFTADPSGMSRDMDKLAGHFHFLKTENDSDVYVARQAYSWKNFADIHFM